MHMQKKHVGCHYLIESGGVQTELLDSPSFLKKICLEFCKKAGVKVLHTHFHQFKPQGVTGLVLIAESHLAIHTWPEGNYCAIDFFTCKKNLSNQNPTDFFKTKLRPLKTRTKRLLRRTY